MNLHVPSSCLLFFADGRRISDSIVSAEPSLAILLNPTMLQSSESENLHQYPIHTFSDRWFSFHSAIYYKDNLHPHAQYILMNSDDAFLFHIPVYLNIHSIVTEKPQFERISSWKLRFMVTCLNVYARILQSLISLKTLEPFIYLVESITFSVFPVIQYLYSIGVVFTLSLVSLLYSF